MSAEIMNYLSRNYMCLILVFGMLLVMCCDNHAERILKHNMGATMILVVVLTIQDYADIYMAHMSTLSPWRLPVSFLGYVLRPMILLLLIRVIVPDKPRHLLWALPMANLLIHTTMFFSHLSVWFTPDNSFHRTLLGYSSHVTSLLLLLILVYDLCVTFRGIPLREAAIPALCTILVVFGATMETVVASGYLVNTIAVTCSLYYCFLHLQYVRNHELAVEEEHRSQIMLSQIQPHFLYNTLSTIRTLCRMDPELAEKTICLFSSYLRYNLKSLESGGLIDFSQELVHTRTYTEIEMLRFPNVHIEYDIADEDFRLPPITLQPLVENAISHGVRSRETGLISIRTYLSDNTHVLILRDNGVGFTPEENADTSAGIQVIQRRLKKVANSTFTVESIPDEGTTITITIPCTRTRNQTMAAS